MLDSLPTTTTATDAWAFPVAFEPVFDERGQELPKLRNLIRTDTNESLGVHKSKYQLITHDTAYNALMDSIKDANISQDYSVKTHVIDNGAKMRMEILFNDIAIPDPEVGDYIKARVQGYNSYDGSWAFQQMTEAFRLWCKNGCTTADTVAKTWAKHTTNVDVQSSAQKITDGIEMFQNNKGVWQMYRETPVTTEQAENLFKKTVCKVNHKASHEKFNDKQLQNLIGGFDNERSHLGNTQWALYNCLTSWATHTEGLRSPENAKRQREAQLVKAFNSKYWKEIA